jgi:hypothetical protein
VVFIFLQKDTVVATVPTIDTPIIETTVPSTIHSSATTASDTIGAIQEYNNTETSALASDYNEKQANTQLLKDLYSQNPSSELLHTLIDVLLAQHRFDEAYGYVQEAEQKYPGSLDPYTHIYAAFHAPSISISQAGSIRVAEDIIEQYRNRNLISADDYLFYQAMIKFWYNELEAARLLLQQITSPKYTAISTYIIETFATLSKQRDIPAYYAQSMISLAVMKQGYYSIAKKLATATVIKDKNYILPYQILAHSHFKTHNRDTAIEYLLILKDLESKQAQRYTFLIGVAHYRRGDYTQAILYLNQVTAWGFIADAYRYMFLSYIQGWSYDRANATWQKLLGNTDISKNDFYSYFYEVFYAPIRAGKTRDMFTNNPNIVQASIQQCFTILPSDYHDVCDYGNAWLALARGNMPQAKQYLDTLIAKYNEPYLLHAIGDYHTVMNDKELAYQYYQKALSTTSNPQEKAVISKKLLETNQ